MGVWFGVLVLSVGTYLPATAQNFHRIPYCIDSLLAHHTISGNILIAAKGKIVYQRAVGFADISEATPMQRSAVFPLAGLSLPLTAYAIIWLQSKGRIAYDSTLSHYLPTFPYKTITIRQLLTHTSGLPAQKTTEAIDSLLQPKAFDQQQNDALPPLVARPGTRFHYSEAGYHLLIRLIEAVSGKSYADFMQDHVFRPARMADASIGALSRLRNRRLTTGHRYDSVAHTFVPLPFSNPNTGTQLTATIFDLYLWDRQLRSSRMIHTQQEEAYQPYRVNEALPVNQYGVAIAYGFGWLIGNTTTGRALHFHASNPPGYTHYMYRFPDRDLCFIMLCNAETPINTYLRNRIVALLSE